MGRGGSFHSHYQENGRQETSPGIGGGLELENEDELPIAARDLELEKPWCGTEQSIDLSPVFKTRDAKPSHTAKSINMR